MSATVSPSRAQSAATRPPAPRVTLDARLIGFAGVGRMIDGLWRGLVAQGGEVTGLWPGGSPRDWMGTHRAPPAGPHVTMGARPFLPAEQLALPWLLRRVHAEVHHAPYFAVPYASRVPIVLTVHDLFPYLNPADARSRAAAAVYRAVIPRAIRRARIVVAVSPFAARQLREVFGLEDARLRVVEHGIDHARWQAPGAAFIAGVRAKHRVPERYLLYVGTLKRHKNLATVLSALRPGHPALVLAGAGAAELEQAGRSLPEGMPPARPGGRRASNRVIALGRVPDQDLAALYAGARALVLPSLYEAVGFTALEAMACGAPVVCSDGGGLPDTVGDAGLVVPALDVAAWSEALSAISEQEGLRERLIAAGRTLALQRSWEATAARYLDLYREAAT